MDLPHALLRRERISLRTLKAILYGSAASGVLTVCHVQLLIIAHEKSGFHGTGRLMADLLEAASKE